MPIRRPLTLALAPVLAVLALSGCGGDDGAATTATASAPAATAAATATTATPATTATQPAATTTRMAASPLTVPAANAADPFDTPRTLQLPAGWKASVWARVQSPRFETWTPQGGLLVAQTDQGAVSLLTPDPADPSAPPKATQVITGLTQPQGMAFDTFHGRRVLYVIESDRLDRYAWSASGPGARTTVVDGLPDLDDQGDDVHRWKSVVVAPDHSLYLPLPSSTNAGLADERMDPPRGTVAKVDPDTGRLTIFAKGIRNGEGLSFAPDGSLWTAVNNRDNIAYPFHQAYGDVSDAFGKVIQGYVDDHPPEEVAKLTKGRDLGWPTCNPEPDADPGQAGTALHYGNLPFTPDAQNNPDGDVRSCADLAPLERGIPAHSAPLGFHFVPAGKLGADRGAGAVLALHGSWNRQPPRAPAVVWMDWDAKGKTLGEAHTLVGGFQDAGGQRWGRPVDAVLGPDGALYVSDGQAGAVYRITPG
jgi:glucose/arabinose dehydrogenase